MQVGELVKLAGLLATHGAALIRCPARLCNRSLHNYWTVSRTRLEHWSSSIKRYTKRSERRAVPPRADNEDWLRMRVELEEIIASELLTRVWMGIACGIDERRKIADLEPPVRSVMLGHLEARHRALSLTVDPRTMERGEAEWLHRLQRRAERWNDLLIGRLLSLDVGDISRAASHPRRAIEFAEDLRRDQEPWGAEMAWSLLFSSLQGAFAPCLDTSSRYSEINGRIAVSILACFPSDMFDSVGAVKSLWQVRLENVSSDAQGLLRELTQPEEQQSSGSGWDLRDNRAGRYSSEGQYRF